MNLNLTLLGEILTFIVFVWFTMRFVWPPMTRALEERREKIAAGLAAAEKSKRELALATQKISDMLADAKTQAAQLIDQAHQRVSHIIEEGKFRARTEGDRLLSLAKEDIQREVQAARDVLLGELSSLVAAGAERILQHEVNQNTNDRIVAELIRDVS